MITVKTLTVQGHMCFEVTNGVNGKSSFVPYDESSNSLWSEVITLLDGRKVRDSRFRYTRLRIIANMDLDSNLPEEIPIVLEKKREFSES